MDKTKKNKVLAAIARFAEQEKLSSTEELEDSQVVVKNSHHPIAWMLLGVAATIFMNTFWNTVQENKVLKARLAEIQISNPYKNTTAKTGFDLYERVPPLPPTITEI